MIQQLFRSKQILDGNIFGSCAVSEDQVVEKKLRESVANGIYEDYLAEVSRHHSIAVMDDEVFKFLRYIPQGGFVCDIGGCWGWHWRKIRDVRPDVTIVIVDFIKSNLIHAHNLLGDLIGSNVYLVHGDAVSLDFKDQSFDGYWSVQTSQHIPNLPSVIDEAHRILKHGGVFVDYVLNNSKLNKLIYKSLGKKYLEEGFVNDKFYIRRSTELEKVLLEKKFNSNVDTSYSEILFKPEVKFTLPGRERSLLGIIDAKLTGNNWLGKLFARQRSYCIKKVEHDIK